jgi:hypothetical protein
MSSVEQPFQNFPPLRSEDSPPIPCLIAGDGKLSRISRGKGLFSRAAKVFGRGNLHSTQQRLGQSPANLYRKTALGGIRLSQVLSGPN